MEVIKPREVRRGKIPAVPPDTLSKIVLEHKSEIVKSFPEETIVQPSHAIWHTLVAKYDLPMSRKAIYEFARKRKEMLFDKDSLGIETYTPAETALSDESSCDESSECVEGNIGDVLRFSISLSPTKWNLIKPSELEFNQNDEPTRSTRKRSYMALKPGAWTDVINKEVWKKAKLKCAWAFKRAKVYPNSLNNYLLIVGKCTGCHASFKASCEKEPVANEDVVLSVSVEGICDSEQHPLSKRQLKGSSRDHACRMLIQEHKTASLLRKEYANQEMDFQDPEPSHLPNLQVLRKAKSNKLATERLDESPLSSMSLLQYSDPYRSTILDMGHDPFFVHYWTAEQLRVFTAYSNIASCTKMCIDATGSLVRKLARPGGILSGHIFLYTGVISLPGEHEGQIPVVQMLSERHNANALTFWLCEWLRSGGKIPDEVVCDYSLALLNSISRAFALTPSTRAYCDLCFKLLTSDQGVHTLPKSFIRVDVAHFIKSVTRWKCLRNKDRRIREFYVRGVARLVLSTTLKEAKGIILALLVVCQTSTEGTSQSTGHRVPCEFYKKKMKDLYSTADVNIIINEVDDQDILVDNTLEDSTEDLTQYSIVQWVQTIKLRSIKLAKKDDGNRDNILQLNKLVDTLCRVCYDLPLWSAIMLSTFQRGNITASSAPVESYFNELKTRLLKHLIPMRVDQFIIKHLEVTDGTMKLAGSVSFLNTTLPTSQQNVSLAENFAPDSFRSTQAVSSEMLLLQNTAVLHSTRAELLISNDEFTKADIGYVDYPTSPTTQDLCAGETASACIACSMGNFPGGAHRCRDCGCGVHLFTECSVSIGEDEGYGEQRLCKPCLQKTTAASSNTCSQNFITLQPALTITDTLLSSKESTEIHPTSPPNQDLCAGKTASVCIACSMGNFPGGAHRCRDCGCGVHLFTECSVSIGEDEGYGEQHLCKPCLQKTTAASSNTCSQNFITLQPALTITDTLLLSKESTEIHPTSPPNQDLCAGKTASVCIACCMGNFPGGAHRCRDCGCGVHLFNECSVSIGEDEGYGEQRLCRPCLEKTTTSNISAKKCDLDRTPHQSPNAEVVGRYIGEMASFENWKGKGTPSRDRGIPFKKRRKSFYLTTSPEWRVMDDSNLKRKVKVGLLKNGNTHSLKSVKVEKTLVSLKNTCAYDSVVQLLAVCYCDSEKYRDFVDLMDGDKGTLGLAMQLAINGSGRQAYQRRAQLICETFETTNLAAGIISYDCNITVTDVVRRFLKMTPSLQETTTCSSSYCPSKTETKDFPLVTIDSKFLQEHGISHLEEAVARGMASDVAYCARILKEELVPEEYTFFDIQMSPHRLCSGHRTRHTITGSNLIVEVVGSLVDMPGHDSIFTEIGVETPYITKLNEFPLQLQMLGKEFTLRGCTSFNPPHTSQGMGHYTAYCRRSDGTWECYDDTSNKPICVKGSTDVFSHLVIYSL